MQLPDPCAIEGCSDWAAYTPLGYRLCVHHAFEEMEQRQSRERREAAGEEQT